ncbi:MFS transporter [Falsiruegeria litorea]|uniref:MFS transporter n=1 Tax=Falsiruegeria litorea TaxID=1280831 RepID=UPI001BFD6B47|nr:MFS transporter [Falsiruegeria litorea]MBT8170720.1 MFS transporter [Falsiruegeria litorea]
MLRVLKHRTYLHLFLAQVLALMGTGLATVALGLLAYDLAGDQAGLVLGTALTIKMLAYVSLAPIAAAFTEKLNRRSMLVVLDLIRAGAAFCLLFVDAIWQIYALIFVLQASSAAFTPTFQATIPDILPDETDYTNALSLSRLAYDLESLLSPILAAALLTIVPFDTLFLGTVQGFLASAILVRTVSLPSPKPSKRRGVWDRTTRGLRIYLTTPRLRGLLALCFTLSMIGSMVLVNTVVLIRATLGSGDTAVAVTLCGFGAGSVTTALMMPRILQIHSDRAAMLAGAWVMCLAGLGLTVWASVIGFSLASIITAWFVLGMGFSAILTPSGRLLRRSAPAAEDRPALFAAQFTLSHACWLIGYPLSGWLMSRMDGATTLGILTLAGFVGLACATRLWPTAPVSAQSAP